ncbi:DUF1461 domain-containing protein [Arthrobacter sp. NPDC092385]|uniref:lipoprotein intramolecular transacylase Lit n=1 Tax=Arthrobacter sp. NPDC092385 TaxID=3363943 RepID=UPI00380C6C20
MAETDSTRSTASGARRLDDESATPPAGAPGASPEPEGSTVSGVAQRHNLPMRKAGTLPDLSRVQDDAGDHERQVEDDAGARADSGGHGSRAEGVQPERQVDDNDARPAGGGTDGRGDGTDGGIDGATDGRGDGDDPVTRMMPVTPSSPVAGATTGASAAGAADPGDGTSTATRPGADGSETHQETEVQPDRQEDEVQPDRPGGATAVGAEEPSTDTAALSVRPPDEEAARRAAVRDQAVAAKPALARLLQVVVALFFPVIVVAAAVRAVASSSFLWLEYHRPGFPADQYGFSLDDRMTYGSYALDYVLNFAPPRYLGGLVTPEGEPLFLESEVGHMADVKGVLGLSFALALVLFVLSVLACAYLARRYKGGVRRALFSGAVLTLVGIIVLAVLAILAWQTFFTQVHALFFAEGTWTFRVDDTLIRLFPEQFWTDSAITVAVLVLVAVLLTLVLTWPTKARRDRSMLAQDALRSRYREDLDAA